MRIERAGVDEYWVVERSSDLEGWTILNAENWKEGVKRLHVRNVVRQPAEFRMLYCADDVLEQSRQSQREALNA